MLHPIAQIVIIYLVIKNLGNNEVIKDLKEKKEYYEDLMLSKNKTIIDLNNKIEDLENDLNKTIEISYIRNTELQWELEERDKEIVELNNEIEK